jgi:hypothetical protein
MVMKVFLSTRDENYVNCKMRRNAAGGFAAPTPTFTALTLHAAH